MFPLHGLINKQVSRGKHSHSYVSLLELKNHLEKKISVNVGILLPHTHCLLNIRELMLKNNMNVEKSSIMTQNVLNFWEFLVENDPIKYFIYIPFPWHIPLKNHLKSVYASIKLNFLNPLSTERAEQITKPFLGSSQDFF